MFKTKLYLYDYTKSDMKGEDFSNHVLQGVELIEDPGEVLDTYEITISGITRKESYAPETKFILELVDVKEYEYEGEKVVEEEIKKTIHMCVSRDMVLKPILSDDNYYDHHISFIEPSVLAQKRLVDNISLTYKLKDVSLNIKKEFPDDIPTKLNSPVYGAPQFGPHMDSFGVLDVGGAIYQKLRSIGKKFAFGNVDSESYPRASVIAKFKGKKNGNGFTKTTFSSYVNLDDFDNGTPITATFSLPPLGMYYGKSGEKEIPTELPTDSERKNFVGNVSYDYFLYESDYNNEYDKTLIRTGSFITPAPKKEDFIDVDNLTIIGFDDDGTSYNTEWILEKSEIVTIFGAYIDYYRKYFDGNLSSNDEPTYAIENVTVNPDKIYTIEVRLHSFDSNIPFYQGNFGVPRKYDENLLTTYANWVWGNTLTGRTGAGFIYTPTSITASTSFTLYNKDTKSILLQSAVPYSAYSMLSKAIVNSGIYNKTSGVYAGDVNRMAVPFSIGSEYVDELKNTQVIESFCEQKNLWQIALEAGNYIHSIPEVRFRKSNSEYGYEALEFVFNRLGRTDEKTDKGNKISIFNSRSIEDYISATSSYVSNMVQLGGYIEEWVSPKTTDKDLLVTNDTVEIITSKPIIELLSITVRATKPQYGVNLIGEIDYSKKIIEQGATADITNYIYEKNIYNLLSLTYNVVPNRGIAIYYELGNNVITGCSYRLPQANTNAYSDESLKKILYSAYKGYPIYTNIPTQGEWAGIFTNQFVFKIKYRTKDTVRQSHFREDLRKYLLTSSADLYPQHNQFNNQTDVLVDSDKFGNNMFGKLIRTGNNSYEIVEWHDNFDDVKQKGELYRINDELYYVSKVINTIYSSYIVSKVSYSKDYNELSKIIGIPSEPRFYEISERSSIRREVEINDFVLLTTNIDYIEHGGTGGEPLSQRSRISDMRIFSGFSGDFEGNYAVTVFKGDSVATTGSDQGETDTYIEIINPVNVYSSGKTLTYSWDMIDNYSAGDRTVSTEEEYYTSLNAVQYTDRYGKAALMDFYIINAPNTFPTDENIQNFPHSPIHTKADNAGKLPIADYNILATNVKKYYAAKTENGVTTNTYNYNDSGIALLKDNREEISINYNIHMVSDSDRFVISNNIFSNKKEIRSSAESGNKPYLVALDVEVNKLSNDVISIANIVQLYDISDNAIISDIPIGQTTYKLSAVAVDINYSFRNNQFNPTDDEYKVVEYIIAQINFAISGIRPDEFNDGKIKSIAIIYSDDLQYNAFRFLFAQNVGGMTRDDIAKPWYIGIPKYGFWRTE